MQFTRTIAVYLFICSVAGIYSPKSKGVTEPCPAKAAESEKDTRPQHCPSDDSPFPVRVIQTPNDAAHTEASEKSTEHYNGENLSAYRDSASAAWSQAKSGWTAVILSFCGLIALIWTLCETRRTANAAVAQFRLQRMNERPLVFAEVILQSDKLPVIPEPNANAAFVPVKIKVKFSNHGRTPAVIRVIRAFSWPYEEVPTVLPPIPESTIPYGLAIASGGEFEVDAPISVSHEDMRNIRSLDKRLFCVGRIEYEDVGGEKFAIGFCWLCQYSNGVDEFVIYPSQLNG